MLNPVVRQMTPIEVYDRLMSARRGDSIEETLARMLASWTCGIGAMPDWLGLTEDAFYRMMGRHFPSFDISELDNPQKPLDLQRMDEVEDLRNLLLQSCPDKQESRLWMVDILIAGCLGSDHLWQDLGLWERADLSRLMQENFGPLAQRNTRDMKWKKFLYKQLCEAEGIYTCRSPSCEVCVDYDVCFGPED
jgi:nitrogen fixation protein NifQ